MNSTLIILEKVATFVGGKAASDLRAASADLAELIEAAKRVDQVSRGVDEWDENNVVKAIHRLRLALIACGEQP